MGAFRKVLCAVDLKWVPDASRDVSGAAPEPLGEWSAAVLRAAHREAQLHDAELAVLHAVPTGPGAPMSPSGAEENILQREELSSAVIDALLTHVERVTGRTAEDVTVHVEDGPADQAIVQGAEELGADLIVLGHTGAHGWRRLLLGSVASAVVKQAKSSVMVVRPTEETGQIVVALDFSPVSARAAQIAAREAHRREATLTVVHSLEVITPVAGEPGIAVPDSAFTTFPIEDLRAQARRQLGEILSEAGAPSAEIEVVIGPPGATIVQHAQERHADLIFLGTSGRSGLDRIMLGSVAAAVVRDAPCSVLVVRGQS
jgi:nucleotide-binding universal stress UspA family protein